MFCLWLALPAMFGCVRLCSILCAPRRCLWLARATRLPSCSTMFDYVRLRSIDCAQRPTKIRLIAQRSLHLVPTGGLSKTTTTTLNRKP